MDLSLTKKKETFFVTRNFSTRKKSHIIYNSVFNFMSALGLTTRKTKINGPRLQVTNLLVEAKYEVDRSHNLD